MQYLFKFTLSYAIIFKNRYILLKFDGENLTLAIDEEFKNYYYDLYRATEIDGKLYILNSTDYRVVAING